MTTMTAPVYWYLLCEVCAHRFASHDKDRKCPKCGGPSRPRGIKVN